ncbi:MAG: thiamine phosphate synthase [Candidatus Parcubacteria bacterium]|nr:thiamine phosphate synthase [Burkholderiales bacterium]
MKLRGLYAITPESSGSEVLLLQVAQALEGGIAALQYRRKGRQQLEEARTLARMCRERAVHFIVNDDVALSLACGADGAHLGRDDGELSAARLKLGGALLGVSCYDSLAAARNAVAAGADYVAFGSVFLSPTKPGAVRAPLSLFGRARCLGVPLVAIGGITLENAPQLLAAGADVLAVISDLFDAPDVAGRARAYGKLFLQ